MDIHLNDDGNVASIIVRGPFLDGGCVKEVLTIAEMMADVKIKRVGLYPRCYEISGSREDVVKVWGALNLFPESLE